MFSDFVVFLQELNLSTMVVTLIISNSLADLVKTLITQFVTPVTDKLLIESEKKVEYQGREIDLNEMINKTLAVVSSLIVSYMIYKISELL